MKISEGALKIIAWEKNATPHLHQNRWYFTCWTAIKSKEISAYSYYVRLRKNTSII